MNAMLELEVGRLTAFENGALKIWREEGQADVGLSLSHLVNNPAVFLELTGEVYRANSALFQSQERSRLSYVGRLRAYRDLSEASNLDAGASFAFGPTAVTPEVPGIFVPDPGAPILEPVIQNRRLFGVDLTYRYRPLRNVINKRLNLRTELIWSRQDLPLETHATAFGIYALGEYQLTRRWFAGGRLDRSERAFDDALTDTAGSVFLTFWPSEFSQVRTQYRRIHFAEGHRANEVLFQLNFSIGAHAAHVF